MDIKPYLKYYLGCDVYDSYESAYCTLVEISDLDVTVLHGIRHNREFHEIKPILKRITDLSYEDVIGWAQLIGHKTEGYDLDAHAKLLKGLQKEGFNYFKVDDGAFGQTIKFFHYLISKGYWLFDEQAFTDGLIIDAKTISNT